MEQVANRFQVSTNYNISVAPWTPDSLERNLKMPSSLCSFICFFYCLLCLYSSRLSFVSSPSVCIVLWRRNWFMYGEWRNEGFLRFALRLKYGEIFHEWQSISFSFTFFYKQDLDVTYVHGTNKASLSWTSSLLKITHFSLQCTYVFLVIITIKSDYFLKHLSNGDAVCFPWARNWTNSIVTWGPKTWIV
jgi:hypothetical protein